MKTTLVTLAIAVWGAITLHAGPQEIIKQRAKDLRDQNNARQDVPATTPAAPSPQTPAPPAATTPFTPQPIKATPAARIKSDLVAWQSQKAITAEAKKEFTQALEAAVRGSRSPSAASLTKLTDSLAAALAGKSPSASGLARLVQNINLALNSAGLSDTRRDEVAAELQADLESAGAEQASAAAAAADLKAVMSSLNE